MASLERSCIILVQSIMALIIAAEWTFFAYGTSNKLKEFQSEPEALRMNYFFHLMVIGADTFPSLTMFKLTIWPLLITAILNAVLCLTVMFAVCILKPSLLLIWLTLGVIVYLGFCALTLFSSPIWLVCLLLIFYVDFWAQVYKLRNEIKRNSSKDCDCDGVHSPTL